MLNNDWKIDKKPANESATAFTYDVDFSVDQKIERHDPDKERFCTYKVMASISAEGKIMELNMKRVVQ